MCIFPTLMINPKYKANKKNGGNPPPLTDERVKYVPIGCQKCIECRNQKARQWQARLTEDIRENNNGKYITLTFSEESLKEIEELLIKDGYTELEGYEKQNMIATKAVRMWLERYRKHYGISIRHWLITELGHENTERIHLHGIIWMDDIQYKFNKKTGEIKSEKGWRQVLKETWQYGWVWDGKGENKENYVSEKTINYIIKYVTKVDFDHKEYIPKVLCSAGIGKGYTKTIGYARNIYKEKGTEETYRLRHNGTKINMPIYWRNKRYTEKEREKLWIEKIDKNIRYIMGVRYVNPTDETLNAAYKAAREHNDRIGYGSDVNKWNEEEYHKNRRKLVNNKKSKKNELKYNRERNSYDNINISSDWDLWTNEMDKKGTR